MSNYDNAKYTIFLDIDGTILNHPGNLQNALQDKQSVLNKSADKIAKWRYDGHHIVLTTTRPEGMRHFTVKQLDKMGIIYDQLVMGLTFGPRYIINDSKEDMDETAFGITVERDKGIGDINL